VSDVTYLGQSVLRVAVLPARVAYLVQGGSESGVRRAVQEACTRWGGMSEPIIPVKPGGALDPWWRQVTALAAVDQLVNVDVSTDDIPAAVDALSLEVVDITDIARAGIGRFTTPPGGIWPAMTPHTAALGIASPFLVASDTQPLCDAVGVGELTDERLGMLNNSYLNIWRHAGEGFAGAQLTRSTLIERTMAQFGEHASHMGPSACPAVVWVTEPDSVDDCVSFWNLRALRPVRFASVPMVLLPVDQVQHWPDFANELGRALARPAQFSPDVVMCSYSVDQAKLRETAGHLNLQLTDEEVRSGLDSAAPNRQAPFTYRDDVDPRIWFVFERTYGQLAEIDAHLVSGTTTVRFASPVEFTTGGLVLIRMWGAPFESLPKRPEIATAVKADSVWSHGAIQLKTIARNDYRFDFHMPTLSETVNQLLVAVTTYELSDKGKLASALRDSADTNILLEPWTFEIITELTTPRSNSLLRTLRLLQAEGAVDEDLAALAAQWGGRVERRYLSASQLSLPAEANASAVLEKLCGIGWAERGLQIVCPHCGLSTFVQLSSASDRAVCPGCQSSAQYNSGDSLTVYYRLNSYLDRASDQGVLPHLLVIAVLSQEQLTSYFLPGINVRFGDDSFEADIFGLSNALVLSGEVKTKSADFTVDQMKRDADLSKRLGADVHLLASMEAVPNDISVAAMHICDSLGLTLRILQKSDLRPGMRE
jgi:hypothetical protein